MRMTEAQVRQMFLPLRKAIGKMADELEDLRTRRVDLALDVLQDLADFSERMGRQAEVLLRSDESGEVMIADELTVEGEAPTSYECYRQFENIDELREILRGRE